MKKLKNVLMVIVSLIIVEFVFMGCVVSGLIVLPGRADSSYNQEIEYNQKDANIKDYIIGEQRESFEDKNTAENIDVIEDKTDVESKAEVEDKVEVEGKAEVVSTPLTIKLSGSYLQTYNNATKNLTNSAADKNRKLVAMIGLQILQSKVIKYENKLHFYSLSYTNSGASQGAKFYSLKDCIKRINAGKRIYTDCFGFVRLTHSIAAYSINPANPENVSGLGGLYGYKGSYTGASISSLSKLNCSTVIYDRLTGSGSSTNRHVAMYLYSDGSSVVYMDQGGDYTGTYKYGSYIYYSKSNPYKFNTFKDYC